MLFRLPAIRGVRRHIPWLTCFAAIASQSFLDKDARTSADDLAVCTRCRERLSEKLLDWCDDLYGDLVDHPVSLTGDAAWLSSSFNQPSEYPHTVPCAELLMSIIDHKDVEALPGIFLTDVLGYLTQCTQRVVRDHRALLPSYLRMLTRLYDRVIRSFGQTSDVVCQITKCVLNVSVPAIVRQRLVELDRNFEANVLRIRQSLTTDDSVRMFAINTCRLDLAYEARPFEDVSEGAIEKWAYAACYTGDVDVVVALMEACPSLCEGDIVHLPSHVQCRMIQIALYWSNATLLRFVMERTTGGYVRDFERVWGSVLNVEDAELLISYTFPFKNAVQYCYRSSAVVKYLLDMGARCFATEWNCSQADFNVDILAVLFAKWGVNDSLLSMNVIQCVSNCINPCVLRELVRTVMKRFGSGLEVATLFVDVDGNRLLNGERSGHTIAYLRTCLHYGVRVDVPGRYDRQTALLTAAQRKMPYAVRYLISRGASCSVVDIDGRTVYDCLL